MGDSNSTLLNKVPLGVYGTGLLELSLHSFGIFHLDLDLLKLQRLLTVQQAAVAVEL